MRSAVPLVRIDQAIGATRDMLIEAHEAAERERRAACALADGNVRLLAYLRRMHGRAEALAAELRRLENRRQAQVARVSERHLELRRLEILIERRADRAQHRGSVARADRGGRARPAAPVATRWPLRARIRGRA